MPPYRPLCPAILPLPTMHFGQSPGPVCITRGSAGLGMGVGALYALLFLAKGTKEVAVVHLMQTVWATSVCLANAQNAGLLPTPAEANIDEANQSKLVPFVVITGVQALLSALAFLLSSVNAKAKRE